MYFSKFAGTAMTALAAICFSLVIGASGSAGTDPMGPSAAAADSPAPEGCAFGSGGKVRQTLTGKQLFITKIKGEAALKAGLSVGMVVPDSLDLRTLSAIDAKLMDADTVICYDGGTATCAPVGWTACPSTGCPPVGLVGQKKPAEPVAND